jgi:hypothetical protein
VTTNSHLLGFLGLARLLDAGDGLPVIGPQMEARVAIVHDFDDPMLYPYKKPAMQKIFTAFREMLFARARA